MTYKIVRKVEIRRQAHLWFYDEKPGEEFGTWLSSSEEEKIREAISREEIPERITDDITYDKEQDCFLCKHCLSDLTRKVKRHDFIRVFTKSKEL